MALDDIVNAQITIESSGVSLPGFGRPLILAVHTNFAERSKIYTDPADMLDDGFLSSDQAYLDAVVLMSQRPRPKDFAIGRRATPVAQTQLFVIPAAPDDSVNYTITINGIDCVVAADADSTQAELRDAMITEINTELDGIVLATPSTNDVLVTAVVPGIPFTFSIDTGTTADITAGAATANVGIPEDVAAINDYDPDWYMLLIVERDEPHIMTAAAVIEAQRRMFTAQSNDAAILSAIYNPADTTTDVASRIKGLGYTRTSVWYHPTDADSLAPAVVGRCLPEIPGSITWMFKQLAGVTATLLTATQRANLLSKNANGYEPCAGRTMTYEGKVGSGEFIDVIHGVDDLHSRLQAVVVGMKLKLGKVAYTRRGLEAIRGELLGPLALKTTHGLIADERELPNGDVQSPAYSVTAPALSDIPAADKAARRIPASNPFEIEATLAGAVHATNIRARLSL